MSTPLPLVVEAVAAVETAAKVTKSSSPGGKRLTKKEIAELVRHGARLQLAMADLIDGGG